MEPRLFNLDPQLLHDAVLLAIAVFVMFLFLSYMLFNPAREMLKKRQDKVKAMYRLKSKVHQHNHQPAPKKTLFRRGTD